MELVDFEIAVFDLDGTLYTTEASVVPAVMETFEEFSLPLPTEDEIKDLIGMPQTHYHDWLREQAGELGEEVVRATDAREKELVGAMGTLYPRARETLEALRRLGCRTALLTNANASYGIAVLEAFSIRHLFDEVSFHELGSGSKTERLRDLVQRLGGGPAIMVGDRFYDIEAAKEASVVSIGVDHGFGGDELKAADIVVGCLWEVVALKRVAVALGQHHGP